MAADTWLMWPTPPSFTASNKWDWFTVLFPGYPPPGSHSRVEEWVETSFRLNQIKDNLVQWEEFVQKSDMCSNSSLTTLDLTFKSSSISASCLWNGRTDAYWGYWINWPQCSTSECTWHISNTFPALAPHLNTKTCVCVCVRVHICTHTRFFPGEENEWGPRDEMTCSLVTPRSVTVPSIQWRRLI